MNKYSLKYNINLDIKTLKYIFTYFDMNEKNTIIKLVSSNKNVFNNLSEFKDNIIKIDNKSIYLKNIKFEKLYYFFSKYIVFNVYYYKVKNIDDIIDNKYEVSVYTRMDKIHEICFDNKKYDVSKVKNEFKKYRRINIEYIILFILLIIGIIIRLLR